MAQVLIVVDAETSASPILLKGTAALQQAITAISAVDVKVVTASEAESLIALQPNVRLCPLTLKLPNTLSFPEQALYQACQDVEGLRLRVAQQWGDSGSSDLSVRTGTGQFWLPIVLTAKGSLYAEVIQGVTVALPLLDRVHPSNATQAAIAPYVQPLHLPDRYRQPLYRLGQRLLDLVSASPAVYLIQFGFQGEEIVFDCLLPFPAAPATASLGIQTPNLFECHWRCLIHQPIVDLRISGAIAYQIYKPGQIESS